MFILICGIVLFLGVHTLTTLREARAELVARFGADRFKGLYSLVAVVGFVLICWGFSRYRANGLIPVWAPPEGMRHLTILLMWFAFVALAAMGRSPSRIRGWLRHPMLVAIKIWALAHLLVNGDLGGMILFASFLAWAVYDRIAVKRRGDFGAPRLSGFRRGDGLVLGAGTVGWLAMMVLHPWLIGVAVIGG
jgi:uncharacterized membrane protein